jgi:hypothetical protein
MIVAAVAVLAPSGASAWTTQVPKPGGGVASVPELDPSSASAALALLGGGVALLSGRRKRSKS